MDMWCGRCGRRWKAKRENVHGVECPAGCKGSDIFMDLVVVSLTPTGSNGEYKVDFVYGRDSTFKENRDGSLTYEVVEFVPEVKKEGGQWVSKGVVTSRVR